jgi:tetratricopeptide (TPR) repeat protein
MKKILIILFAFLGTIFFNSFAYAQTFNELIEKYKEAQKSKDYEEMTIVLTKMLKKYPDKEPEITYFNRGNAYRVMKQYEFAKSDYTDAIKIKTDYIDAYYNRGMCYLHLEDYDSAVFDFNLVIKSKQNDPYVYFNRGNAYSGLYKYDDAIADYTQAIQLYPDYTDAYYNRGNKYYGLEMYEEAVKDWEMVKKLDPANATAIQEKIDEAKSKLKRKK